MSRKDNYRKYRQETISIDHLNTLDNNAQKKLVSDALTKMWNDEVKVEEGHINKVLKLSVSKKDDEIYLPKKLLAKKDNKNIVLLYTEKTNPLFFIILFAALLLVGAFSATYSGIIFLKRQELNIDIDNDGIPDINLDLDNDDVADVNIDITSDNKPDLNLDYKGNKKAVFNIDSDGDNKPDKNLVNDATGDTECKLNCDSNGNGWPNYNIDLDGDGKADVDIDTNGDKIPDLNIDLDGDGIPDINIDDVGDGKCHKNCTNIDLGDDIKTSGPSTINGDQNINNNTASLMVIYQDNGPIIVDNIFPDDQENVDISLIEKKFTVTNNYDYYITYKMSWAVSQNTFTSENFKYKIESDNEGYNNGYITAPKTNVNITDSVLIAPHTVQHYTITFNLFGTNAPQNYDQNRVFVGYVKIGD